MCSGLPKQAAAGGYMLFVLAKDEIAANFLCQGREDKAVLICPSPGHSHGPSMNREPDPGPEESEMELPWDLWQ